MRSFKVEGIIIKRKNYGEADRLLTVLTKNNGKIQVKATGIRRIPSRRSAHVELLNHSILSLYKGKTYATLTEAQAINNFSPIKNNLEKMGLSYHLCELIDGLCAENQENIRVFYLLKNNLTALTINNNPRASIREFEIELLTILGYLPNRSVNNLNTRDFIENILERRLKSYPIFARLQE